MEETGSSNIINKKKWSSKTNLYDNYLSKKSKKLGKNQNRVSMKVNSDSTQLNAR